MPASASMDDFDLLEEAWRRLDDDLRLVAGERNT
jgi:hypothetical protein